ncbi:Transient receptor hypothetical-gamma protein, partial [Stegodyphus mimosarum]
MSYFEDGSTVPPPFNIFPTPKLLKRFLVCSEKPASMSVKVKEEQERDFKYRSVMRCLIRRYVTTQQRKAEETGVTEDDVNEVKQAVTSFRSELFDILRKNGMKGVVSASETLSRKERLRERRLLKDFNIDLVETVMEAFMKDSDSKNKFGLIRRLTGKRENAKKNWNAIVGAARSRQNPIGRTNSVHTSGSIKELRDKVLQEEELPQARGVRRFAAAARRVLHDQASRSNVYENTNSIASIEEEVPGTFSASVTPRNSVPQEAVSEESRRQSTDESSHSKSNLQVHKQESAVINLENTQSSSSSSGEVKSPSLKQGPKVQGLISRFDPSEEITASPEIRRHSAPPTDGKNATEQLAQRRGTKVFPKTDENVGWL